MKKQKKTHNHPRRKKTNDKSKKKKKSSEEYIGFKLVKPVPPSELLPDYEKIKNSTLPSALKATLIANLIKEKPQDIPKTDSKETIENQSNKLEIERYQYQNDTSIKMTPVSNLDQYQNDTGIKKIEGESPPLGKSQIEQHKTPTSTPSEEAEAKTLSSGKEIQPIKIKQLPDTANEKIKFKPGFFSQWENSIFNELRKVLSNSEFKIYTVLFEESWVYGKNLTGIIGYKTISERTGLGRATIIRNIEKLIKRKIIEKRTSFNNLGTIYKVNLPEIAEIEIPKSQTNQNPPQEDDQYQNETGTGIKMIPVLVSKRYQSPSKIDEETIENQSNSKIDDPNNILSVQYIYNEKETIENQKNFKYQIHNDEKFIIENNLIKILNKEEIIKTLKSKPFSLKDEAINILLKTASPELISLKIENAIFNHRRNLIKKPGEWLLISIFNNFKTTKQFLKYLKEKLQKQNKEKNEITDPIREYMIKTVFGYHTKFLRTMPTKETLIKELQRYNIPDQTINNIINNYPPEYIFFQIKHADFRANEIKDPTSWLINAITKAYKPSREFARKIESLIKQIEEEKLLQEKNRKIEEERKLVEKALAFLKTLPQNEQQKIVKLAEEKIKNELNITPDTPGYKINLDYKITEIINEKYKLNQK